MIYPILTYTAIIRKPLASKHIAPHPGPGTGEIDKKGLEQGLAWDTKSIWRPVPGRYKRI